MRGKACTNLELALITDMFHRGASIQDISKRVGRTTSSVRTRLNIMGLHISERDAKHKPEENVAKPIKNEDSPTPAAEAVCQPQKQKTLNDFSPREIIRHMYNLGYRIKGGDLYQIVEKKVLLNDILV